MNIEELDFKFRAKIKKEPYNYGAYEKHLMLLNNIRKEDTENGISGLKWLSGIISERMIEFKGHGTLMRDMMLLHQQVLLSAAVDDFDSFMQALEFNRRPQERFWLPRRRLLLPDCMALQDLADDKLDELFIGKPPRIGKALADDTPILTRNGWKNHGDLAIGDEVIGMDGNFKKVIAVHPKCQLDVMVEFTNGEKIQCHENHEWMVHDRATNTIRILETKVLEKRALEVGGPCGKRGHRYMLQLPKRNYVIGEKKKLPIDPYLFGVWLGDGANKNPRICNAEADKAIIDRVVANGYTVRWSTKHKTTGVWYYDFDIRKELQVYGLCHSRRTTPKYIPETYLTASVEQRLELLAGLIDTDGTFAKKENRYHFATCEESLRDSFIQLISTFGWRTSVSEYEPIVSSSGVAGKNKMYQIGFCPDCVIPCELERKRNAEFAKRRAIAIKSIKRVQPKQGNCITVEDDGMYLAGHTMLPTHNTTLIMMFLLWEMGRNSERSNLYSSFTAIVVDTFYNGLLEILNDPATYDYGSIFPGRKVIGTNAKEATLDLDRRKRYHSFTGRPIGGSLNGSCDCNGYIVGDDLCSGIEEALSKDRMASLWTKVDNNFLTRAKEKCKRLWIGTRWSLVDPQGIRLDLLQNDPQYRDVRWKCINTPALNSEDKSNFEYAYGVGYSTEYYKQRRASFERNNDMASWLAQYQGEPIERDGAVFSPDDLRYYNGTLPDADPDRVFMAVDPAWGGGDYVAGPVIYQYGDDLYVHDVVYDNGDKKVTQPLIVGKVKKYDVQALFIEATKMTASYPQEVDAALREKGIKINIQSTTKHFTGTGKEQRIFDKAPDIRERMVFLESGKRSKEYEMFMQNLFAFSIAKKNQHDDAPDSLAIALSMAIFGVSNKVEIVRRPF